jgi:predicted SAM-dependent methyltransferase
MISRSAKAAYYFAAAPLMRANGAIYRALRSPRTGVVKVHLGPGQEKYLDGWINVDANAFTAKCDVWADLRNPLPFHDGTVDAFYSHHMIEHLPNIETHFSEVFRCLKPGGLYRVGGPHGDSAIRKFAENDSEWFGDYPDKRRSIGGRFANFIFCRNEHLTILTTSFLEEMLGDAGFVDMRVCAPITQTFHPGLIDAGLLKTEYESTPDVPHTLIVEARKPPVK